jgi:hypothetical protein
MQHWLMNQGPSERLDLPRYPAQRQRGPQDGGHYEPGPSLRTAQYGAGAPLLLGEDYYMPSDAAGAFGGVRSNGRAAMMMSRSGVVGRLGLCLCFSLQVLQLLVVKLSFVCTGLGICLGECIDRPNTTSKVSCSQHRYATSQGREELFPCCLLCSSKAGLAKRGRFSCGPLFKRHRRLAKRGMALVGNSLGISDVRAPFWCRTECVEP